MFDFYLSCKKLNFKVVKTKAMRNIILFLWLSSPGLVLSQNHISVDNDFLQEADAQYVIDCVDLDETIINILSIFMNDPGFGFFGCSDVIPYLESQLFIPLNCSTDLTPFGYFNIDVSDVCECSCEESCEYSSECSWEYSCEYSCEYAREYSCAHYCEY